MAGNETRVIENNKCGNCDGLLEMLKRMDEKMDEMKQRFDGVENLMKQENDKLSLQLKAANKRYDDVCDKLQVMSVQINQLKQENLSRHLIIKGVPEIENDNMQLKQMVGKIFTKLRFELQMTYIDCYRIGKKTDKSCRPIVVVVFNVGLKNIIIRDKYHFNC